MKILCVILFIGFFIAIIYANLYHKEEFWDRFHFKDDPEDEEDK